MEAHIFHPDPPTNPNPTTGSALSAHAVSKPAEIDQMRDGWKGWSEIESEPAIFNILLKRIGVRGIRVQEIVSLEDEVLANVTRPVHGLVFLFRWAQTDSEPCEGHASTNVWFANQTVSNACATVALLNIVNNCVPAADLGEHLVQFKSFSESFSPALRGDAIGNFEFLRQIHNSFARKMDILNNDLALKDQATRSHSRKRRSLPQEPESQDAFHFVAFVPVGGTLWRLGRVGRIGDIVFSHLLILQNGLEREPRDLGQADAGDWLLFARPTLQAHMARYGDQHIEFVILGLVRDTAYQYRTALAENIRAMQQLSGHPWWHEPAGILLGPSARYDIDQPFLDRTTLPASDMSADTPEIFRSRIRELRIAQDRSKLAISESQEAEQQDEERCDEYRLDYGTVMHKWTGLLARKGVVESLLNPT